MKKVALVPMLLLMAVFGLATVSAQTTIRISGWPGNPDEEAGVKMMVDAFNAKHPNINLVWEPTPGDYNQTLKTRLAGGTAADLFYLDVSAFEEFARSGNLLPLDSYLKDGTLNDFPKPLIDAFTFNKRIYGIAKDFSTLGVMFNKEIFDKAKVAYPTSNMTYTQFYQMLRRLKAAGVKNPMVINADFNRMIPFIIANGGRIVDDQLNIAIDDAKGKAAIKQYIELFAKDQLGVEASGVGAGWEGEAFGKEQVALIMTGPWSLGYLKGSFPNVYKKIGVVEMPRGTSKSTMIYTVSWSINRQTKNRAEAITVLKFLVNEGQKIFVDKAGVLGSNKKIAASDTDPIKTAFYKGADYGTPWRILTPSGLFSRANDEINSRIKDAFFGKISVDQMLQQIRQNYDSWVE